jgi:hypothetical protein
MKEILFIFFLKRVNNESNIWWFIWGIGACSSLFIYFQICMSGWATGYSYRCQPVDYSDNPMAMRVSCVNYYARNNFSYPLTNLPSSNLLLCVSTKSHIINYFTLAGLAILIQPFQFLVFFVNICHFTYWLLIACGLNTNDQIDRHLHVLFGYFIAYCSRHQLDASKRNCPRVSTTHKHQHVQRHS